MRTRQSTTVLSIWMVSLSLCLLPVLRHAECADDAYITSPWSNDDYAWQDTLEFSVSYQGDGDEDAAVVHIEWRIDGTHYQAHDDQASWTMNLDGMHLPLTRGSHTVNVQVTVGDEEVGDDTLSFRLVCAHPCAWARNTSYDNWYHHYGYTLGYQWESTVGDVSDLKHAQMREYLTHVSRDNPPFTKTSGSGSTWRAEVGAGADTHAYPEKYVSYQGTRGDYIVSQLIEWRCDVCGHDWETMGNATITRTVDPVEYTDLYIFITRKVPFGDTICE